MYTYLNDLNEAQKKAVENFKGPSLVIAGAGSGKTRVLTYRITHLLAKGIPAYNILALTFTNKAAREMKERITKIVGEELAKSLWMGTFHSIFAKILRFEADRLGFTSNYIIYDTIDSRNLIKKIIKDLQLSDKDYPPNQVHARISSAKNNLITAQAYLSNSQIMVQDQKSRRPRIADIYLAYSNRCKKNDAMDFDDLLVYTNILFRDFPDILAKYQDKFKYVLVDEYQDTNFAQYLIINKLCKVSKNICVVGDDAQSIYSFRGAKIENILNFKNDYPEYKLYKLEQNYRSTQNIVNAANSIIKKNKEQIPKNVYSKKDDGELIKVIANDTDKEEAFFVAQSIQSSHMENDLEFKEFAILYRTNAQSRSFEEALRRYNIPYKIYGSISFYQRKEIKDILAYFRCAVNKRDSEAILRIINYPTRGIGQTTVEKLEKIAAQTDKNIWDVLLDIDKFGSVFNSGTINKIKKFTSMISGFSDLAKEVDAYEAASEIAKESGVIHDLSDPTSHEAQTKYENLEEMLNGIKEYVDNFDEEEEYPILEKFIENVSLLTNTDNESPEDFNKVTIMTIHAAKGLEFRYVFLVGLEEDLFPSKMSSNTQKELEEERRLFYVAVTRAEHWLTITYANNRYKWGVPTSCMPSRFIKEIDEKYLELPSDFYNQSSFTSQNFEDTSSSPHYYKKKAEPKSEAPIFNKKLVKLDSAARNKKLPDNFESADPSTIDVGMVVLHNRFGVGEVLSIEGDSNNRKAKVHFASAGEKQLLLKFAKLQIVTQ